MPRTAVPYSNLVSNGSIVSPAGTALNPGVGNGHVVPATQPGADASPELTILRVTVGATGGDITIKAGTYPPALAAGQGDLVVNVANNGTRYIGPIESGRFLQADGSILVDVAAAVVPGTITAFKVPRNT